MLPPDVRRVVGRWNPDALDRLDRAGGAVGRVNVMVAPGIDDADVRRVLDRAGWTVTGLASASVVVVLPDPDLPVGRELATSVRDVPADVPVVVVATSCAVRPGAVPTVVEDLIATLDRCVGDVDDGEVRRLALGSAITAARSALAAAARADTASDDIAALRERRRVAGARIRDDPSSVRRRVAEARLDLAHRVGVHRRETSARVTEAVAAARPAELSRVPAAVTGEIDAASDRLSQDVSAALRALDVVEAPARFGASDSHQPLPPRARRSVEDVLAGVVGASAGAGVGRVAAWALSMSGPLALVVATLGAVAMATAVVRTRSTSAERARVRRWAAEVVADAAATWDRDVASRFLAADAELAARLAGQADDAATRRDARLADIDREIREVTSRASARAAAYQRDLEVLESFDSDGTEEARRASKHVSGGVSAAEKEPSDGRMVGDVRG